MGLKAVSVRKKSAYTKYKYRQSFLRNGDCGYRTSQMALFYTVANPMQLILGQKKLYFHFEDCKQTAARAFH